MFSGGEIGGFLITDNTIETSDFVSGLKGIRLSTANNGSIEAEEAKIRGTLKTTVFEKESKCSRWTINRSKPTHYMFRC